MADNTILNPGVGGDVIATDDIAGVKHELVKVEFGADGSATQVSPANPLPVADAVAEAALASIAAEDFATHAAQIDGSQKAQIVDALGNPVSVTGNKLDVNATFSGDIEIGAVELKNATTDDRAAVINAAPTTEFGLVTRNIPSGTQPISAASLPLPTGAATEATLALIEAGIPAALGQTTMANSAPVVIASNQTAIPVTFSGPGSPAVDNTQLYSGTLSVTGAITGIDTTGYSSVIAQITGQWAGNFWFEGSNDNTNWQELTVISLDNVSIQDVVTSNSTYIIKTTTKFVRLNVIQLQTGSITALILGRTVQGISGIDILTLAMDRNNNTPLYVSESDSKKDITNALIPSDAPKPIYGYGNIVNAVPIQVDTTGYQSIAVQTFGTYVATVTFQASNDGITWSNVYALFNSQQQPPTQLSASIGLFNIPVVGKYFRLLITAYTSGTVQVLAYLRQQPLTSSQIQTFNLAYVNGSAINATTGSSGVPIGGVNAVGTTSVMGPVITGGVDANALVRRFLLDSSGRTIVNINAFDPTGTARALGSLTPGASIQNIASLSVQDTSQFEGQSFMELLGQLLLEMRINNQLLSELPVALQSQNGKLDEPALFRNDPSIFVN